MRKRIYSVLILILLLLINVRAVSAQTDESSVTATCPDGQRILNGAEILVNIRSGFIYTATVVGIDGFNPVMAIADRNSVLSCADNSVEAERYSADLPTTGFVPASTFSAQLPFSHTNEGFENISVIVGSANGASGEFVLIIEGASVTSRDGDGDLFYVRVTENMIAADADTTVYMLAVGDRLDSYLRVVNSNNETITGFECNDAGTATCQQASSSMAASYVSRTRGRQTTPNSLNAMVGLPLPGATLDLTGGFYISFLMSSPNLQTTGDYVAAFHIAVGQPGSSPAAPTPTAPPQPTATPLPPPPTPDTSQGAGRVPGGGIDVVCPNGFEITNAVEIIVNMRPGFTYTATVIGIDGFDPVMAVQIRDTVRSCADDVSSAAQYAANLPSTGRIPASPFNAQLPFSHNFNGFEDISIIVGGFGGASGQFLLILEGMAVTAADGTGDAAGDPFALRLTPNIVNAPVDMTVYMIGVDRSLDPLVRLVNSSNETILRCDDAGVDALCAPGSSSLVGSTVSRTSGRQAQGDELDAMLVVATTTLTSLDFTRELYLNFLMTSFNQRTNGEYTVAFHIGIGDPGDPQGNPDF